MSPPLTLLRSPESTLATSPPARPSGVVPRYEPGAIASALAEHGIDLASFDFHVSSTRARSADDMRRIATGYACWSELSKAMQAEHGRKGPLASDEFSRQDEWAYLAYAGECVAVAGFRWLDMRLPFYADDSYFRIFPEDARQRLIEMGPRVCVVSNFVVSPAWRGRFGEFSVKELIVALCIQHFDDSEDADVAVAVMRNERGMNAATYRFGAKPLATAVVHPVYGDKIDIVARSRADIGETRPRNFNGDLCQIILCNEQREESTHEAIFG